MYHGAIESIYNSHQELLKLSEQLDTARPAILYRIDNGLYTQLPHHIGIVNTNLDEVVCVASNKYTIFQHNEALTAIVDGLENQGIKTHGILVNCRNSIDLNATIEGLHIDDGSEHGLDIGARITNSMDKTNPFKGITFAYSKDRKSYMYLPTSVPKLKFTVNHLGKVMDRVPERVQHFTSKIIEQYRTIETYINTAKDNDIYLNSKDELIVIVDSVLKNKYHSKRIADQWAPDQKDTNQYDIYGLTMEYINNDIKKYTTKTALNERAEKLLTKKVDLQKLFESI